MNDTQINFANGGEGALEEAIEKYGYAILRYCHNILCDYYEAQDAVQITFIKAYNKRTAYDNNKNLSSWLYQIAYNTCIDIIRKRKLARNIQPMRQVTQDSQDSLIPENIKNALMSLTLLDRSLVYERVIEEKPYDELAVIHRKSAANLRKRYERARKKLAFLLKDDYPDYSRNESQSLNYIKEESQ